MQNTPYPRYVSTCDSTKRTNLDTACDLQAYGLGSSESNTVIDSVEAEGSDDAQAGAADAVIVAHARPVKRRRQRYGICGCRWSQRPCQLEAERRPCTLIAVTAHTAEHGWPGYATRLPALDVPLSGDSRALSRRRGSPMAMLMLPPACSARMAPRRPR
jgi:hypothetical protein